MKSNWWEIILALIIGGLMGYLAVRLMNPPVPPFIGSEEQRRLKWYDCIAEKKLRNIPLEIATKICLEELKNKETGKVPFGVHKPSGEERDRGLKGK